MRRSFRAAAIACAASSSSAPMNLAGHRAILLGPLRPAADTAPPLVLLGGTAQWLDSWTGHLTALAAKREVLLYETRGQGGAFASSALDVSTSSLDVHAADFLRVVEAGLPASTPSSRQQIDCVGFSFGGRVAMAAAAAAAQAQAQQTATQGQLPLFRRLCVTGVSADRGPRGRLALQSWRQSLAADDLKGFVWKLILDTYSGSTLQEREAQVPSWVEAVAAANTVEGLREIVEQTHTEDPADPYHPLSMAHRIRSLGAVEKGLLLCGEEDVLSPQEGAEALAEAAGWRYEAIPRAAHAAPIEQPVVWRRRVLDFLDDKAD